MRRFFWGFATCLVIVCVAILTLRLLYPVPDVSARIVSSAIAPNGTTLLGNRMAEAAIQYQGKSGVLPLRRGHDALASRLVLADMAQQSIDAQYYIWHDDTSGMLLLDALNRAARRGVRVRLLLDDNGVPGLDDIIAALDAQPNFDIRLFNPSTVRSPKWLGYLFDFPRMNRRMHNKAFIADGAAAIIGGRNIGDEYFQVGNEDFYVDMDVLATGAIVSDTAAAFDTYWNSKSVHAADTIINGKADIAAFQMHVEEVKASEEAKDFLAEDDVAARSFAQGEAALEWTKVRLVVDDPVKGEGLAQREQLMISRLAAILGDVRHRLLLVSAYFVPGRQGSDYFDKLARDGRDVRVLTNALNTTDVLPVHAGYAKYRKELLKAGVKLYELKLRGEMVDESGLQLNPFGLSGASLHAKTFAVDDNRIFIGSFNFDPRSALLNCEMGFLIDSPSLARSVSDGFGAPLDSLAYRPELTPDGKMVWQDTLPNGTHEQYDDEPGTTWLTGFALTLIGLLPVEWLL